MKGIALGVIRLFLALVVVTAHFQQAVIVPNHLNSPPEHFLLGFHSAYAVLFFYCISGFLITFTLLHNYVEQPSGTLRFYKNRFVRIFSLYWPILVLTFIALPGAYQAFSRNDALNELTNIFLIGADWNLDFGRYPNDNWDALPKGIEPAWTLGAELTFYILAPFLVRRWPLVLTLFIGSLLLRGALVLHLGTHIVERWTYYFAPATFLFFLCGQGICMLGHRYGWLRNKLIGCASMIFAFLTMLLTHDTGFDIPRLWVSMAFFTLGLPGFFEATKDVYWMNVLGNLSYPVYLTHKPAIVFGVAAGIFKLSQHQGLQSTVPLIIAFLVCGTLTAAIAHLCLERPSATIMKFALDGRKPAVSSTGEQAAARSSAPGISSLQQI